MGRISTVDILFTSGKYIESLQELAMSSKAAESKLTSLRIIS
jgi:hypothetical protein